MPRAAQLASSFAAVADDYDVGRPAYPAEMVRWVLGSKPRRVLDVGAGTGKLTEMLAADGHEVTAAEPLEDMASVLTRKLRGVRTVNARAEQLPLPEQAFDAVVVAQAFHWFDQRRALSEMARVAVPGAVLGLFWNVYAGLDDWVPYPRQVPAETLTLLTDHPCWAAVEHRSFAWNFPVTKESLLAFIRSHSSMAVLSERSRTARAAALEGHAAGLATHGTLPLVTHAWRCRLVR